MRRLIFLLTIVMMSLLCTAIVPAWAVNELIRPRAVIPTHANEESTKEGKVKPGSKAEKFIQLVRGIPVYLPLSGKTMEFDGDDKCVSGCY